MGNFAIGVDIGGSHLSSAAIDLSSGMLLEESRVHRSIDSEGSAEEIFLAWAGIINASIERAGSAHVKGIGLAMPGPFDYTRGVAFFKGNEKYEALYGMPVEEHLRSRLILPEVPIRFHNDASCFAIGEDGYGGAKGTSRSLSLTLGTGFGSAFIDEGVPIVVREDVPEDGCLWHLPFKDGIADQYFSTRWFRNQYEHETGIKITGVKELVRAAKTNSNAVQLFKSFGSNLAEFLNFWIEAFRPEVIILGGNISRAHDLFLPAFRSGLTQDALKPKVKVTELGEDAAIMGAARLLDDSYFSKIEDFLPTK